MELNSIKTKIDLGISNIIYLIGIEFVFGIMNYWIHCGGWCVIYLKLLCKICPVLVMAFASITTASFASETVTVDNFVRAETDVTLWRYVKQGAFARIFHIRQPVPLDKQDVIRMNRDTLYSGCCF